MDSQSDHASVSSEMETVLTSVIKDAIQTGGNIDDVCAAVNRARLEGRLWTVIQCWPAADVEDEVLIQSVVAGERVLLSVSVADFQR